MKRSKKVEDVQAKTMPGVQIPARMYLKEGYFQAIVENGDWERVDCGHAIRWNGEYRALGPKTKEDILQIISFLHRVVWAMEATSDGD